MVPSGTDDCGDSHLRRGAKRDVIDVEWWSPDGSVGGLIRADVRADPARTAFLVAVVGPGRAPVVVIDHGLPLPTTSLELRASGIWVALVCEEPLDHWTVGLEAFGLVVDPEDVIDPETFGDRVPVGLDLDLDTVGEPRDADGGFEMGLRVHGEVLVADEVLDIDGGGVRRRRWDGRPPTLPPIGAAPSVASVAVRWPGPGDEVPVRRHLMLGDGLVGWAVAQ